MKSPRITCKNLNRIIVKLHSKYSKIYTDAKLKEKDEDNILGDVRRDIDAALSHHHGGNKHQRYQGNRGVGELKKELRERGLVCYQQFPFDFNFDFPVLFIILLFEVHCDYNSIIII